MGSRFSCKSGGGVVHIGGVYGTGWAPFTFKSLLRNNVLYLASLSFIFILTPFDTRDYYCESSLSLVLVIEGFHAKKHIMLFCSLLSINR